MPRSLIPLLLLLLLAPASYLRAAGVSDTVPGTTAADTMTVMLDINTAGYDELLSVRGIGPALAGRILDYRADRGSFSRLEELLEVQGIGEKNLVRLRKYLTLSAPPSPEATRKVTSPR